MRFNLSVLKRNFAIIVWLMSILVRRIKSAILRPCFFNSHQTFSFDFQGWRKNYNEWKTSEYFPFISSRLVWDKQTHKKNWHDYLEIIISTLGFFFCLPFDVWRLGKFSQSITHCHYRSRIDRCVIWEVFVALLW